MARILESKEIYEIGIHFGASIFREILFYLICSLSCSAILSLGQLRQASVPAMNEQPKSTMKKFTT